MPSINNLLQQVGPRAIFMRMVIGTFIGFAVISFFVFGVDHPHPDWGKYWRVRPLIITPLAGAFGILSFYLTPLVDPKNKALRVLLIVLSALAFIVALWLGIVLGLRGTMWH